MSVGSTVVAAMRADALAHAFCIATDATGVLVQPMRTGDKQRRACTRGHYFVQIADVDQVFFEYTAKETAPLWVSCSAASPVSSRPTPRASTTCCSVPPAQRPPPLAKTTPSAVRLAARRTPAASCGRAAITKDAVAREGLARISARGFGSNHSNTGVKQARSLAQIVALFRSVASIAVLRTTLGESGKLEGRAMSLHPDGKRLQRHTVF